MKWLSWILCILIACVFSIKDFRQLDFFWMLRTGNWIIQNKTVPATDILSYTFQGAEWLNVKWGFEVLISYIERIGGPEFIPVLQLIVNVLAVIFIFKLSVLLKRMAGEKGRIIPTAGIIIATYLFLFGTEYRMTGRPEIISHLMTLLFLFIHLSYKNSKSKIIWLLIPLQIIWTNCHDAFVNGCIITLVFIFSSLLEYLLYKKKRWPEYTVPKQMFAASILSLLAVGINPKGALLYTYPFEIFSSLNNNSFTQEFLSCFNKNYWMGKEAYLLIIAFIISLCGFLFYFKRSGIKNGFLSALQTFSIGYFVLLLLFLYLALSAERNVVFFMIISAPLISVTTDRLLSNFSFSDQKKQTGYMLAIGLSVLLYVSICNNSYYKKTGIPYQYGFSMDRNETPTGTVQFMNRHAISGTAFSDYLTSSVFLWYRQPDFKSYIDLRDLEVFTPAFFNEYQKMLRDPSEFQRKDEALNFDYAVIYPGDFPVLHSYLYNNPNWVLAYFEPSCALYLKKNERNKKLIGQLALKDHPDVFHVPLNYKASKIAVSVSKLFWPFYKTNASKNETAGYDNFAARFYQQVTINKVTANDQLAYYRTSAQAQINKGDLKKALFYLEQAITILEDAETYLLMAQCAGTLHTQIKNDTDFMDDWFMYMQKAATLSPNDRSITLQLGLAYCMDKKDCTSAKKYLDKLNTNSGISEQDIKLLKMCKEYCRDK